MINITTNQLAEILAQDSNINLYDLRTPIEFASGHIPDSHNLPFEELKYFNDPKNETYYFICRSGDLSHHVCQLLKSKGYNNLINISDGILNWKGKIRPVDSNHRTQRERFYRPPRLATSLGLRNVT